MQAGLTAADRKILWTAGGLLAVLTVLAVAIAPTPESESSSVPSSYLSTPGGARAAFLLLQRLGMKAQRWEEPPFRLDEMAQSATLVIAQPTEKPSHAERAALKRFVEHGGRALFCGQHFLDFFPEPIPAKVGAETWATTYGAGELIRWRTADPLTNAKLNENLPLFLNSIGAGSRKYVIWDEYFHGERGSLWDYIGRVPAIRWSLLPFGLLLCAALFTYSRRRGPVIVPVRVSRLSPLEFVDSLGTLYRKAKATSIPVEVTARELRLQLLRRLALPANLSDDDLAREAAVRLGLEQKDLHAALSEARAAGSLSTLGDKPALKLVQALQRFTNAVQGLGVKRPS